MKKGVLVTILLFFSFYFYHPNILFAADENLCDPGYNEGVPLSSITYDYGPDNLLRFHISLSTNEWRANAPLVLSDYASYKDCSYFGGFGSAPNNTLYGVSHLLVKFHESESSAGYYFFDFYNEDTGEPFVLNSGIEPKNFPVRAIGFGENRYNGAWFRTPAVKVKKGSRYCKEKTRY